MRTVMTPFEALKRMGRKSVYSPLIAQRTRLRSEHAVSSAYDKPARFPVPASKLLL